MYLERAQTLPFGVNPRLWLDVGAGHGHFCKAARKIWPETKFHGLDISESVRLAERRGWLERAYQGLLLDKAENMACAYDVVSMSHYLEHTQQPRAEIMAANLVLRPEGYLLIEVPDPESAFANLLGKYWVAYFQPQHQHISKLDNLKRILRKSGFEIIRVNRENAHNPVDLSCAVYFLLGQIAPPINAPWRSATSWDKRLWRFIVWGGCVPVLALARLLDKVIVPWSRRPGWSNAYRILARKENELGKSAKAELQAQAKMDSGGTKVIRG
jgi:SAM-dependent methyltransferase